MDDRFDVIIAGGGLNGGALALALGGAGLTVGLFDPAALAPRTEIGFDGRGYALALTSQRLLQVIGVWSAAGAHSQPIRTVKVAEGHAGTGALPFSMIFQDGEIDEGPMGYMIEDRYLRLAMLAALRASAGVTVIEGQAIVGQAPDAGGIAVTTDRGGTYRAAVLIGCDGRASQVAARAGLKRSVTDYRQTALVCAVAHERPHDGTAWQYFMPAGPLAVLPLPGNQSSIVWTERTETAQQIAAMDDAGFLAALRPRFGDFLGAVELAGARFSYPLNLSLASDMIAPRVALVGDAAHGVHPIAGQGLNAGLKDVAALTEVLATARRRGEDIGRPEVLARYRQWRRFDVATLAAATDAFNRLFSNDSSLLRGIGALGLAAVNAMPGLRRGLIREAAGLTGDLPRLLQGRAV